MDLVLKNCKLINKNGQYHIKVKDGKISDMNHETHYKKYCVPVLSHFIE